MVDTYGELAREQMRQLWAGWRWVRDSQMIHARQVRGRMATTGETRDDVRREVEAARVCNRNMLMLTRAMTRGRS